MPHFVCQQEADGLQALLAPVNVVPQKKIVGLRREASIFEQPQQVRVLPMDVACKSDKPRSVSRTRSTDCLFEKLRHLVCCAAGWRGWQRAATHNKHISGQTVYWPAAVTE